MSILRDLSGATDFDEIRHNRIKHILKNNVKGEEEKQEEAEIDKDDARFIQLLLQDKWNKYHIYFGDYNTSMFQKLCVTMEYKELNTDDIVFNQGEPSSSFYFIIKGTIHTLEKSMAGEDKISNIHNDNQVFGLK